MTVIDVSPATTSGSSIGSAPAARQTPSGRCARSTLQVPRGTSMGVIGRNGAGKSTLFKLLAGITAPTRGRIVD